MIAVTGCGNVDDYYGNKTHKDDNIDQRFGPCLKSNTPDMNKCLQPHSNQKYVQCLVQAWESLKAHKNGDALNTDVATCKKLYTEAGSGKKKNYKNLITDLF